MNEELALYKLVMGQAVADAKWINEYNFCVWIFHFAFADLTDGENFWQQFVC